MVIGYKTQKRWEIFLGRLQSYSFDHQSQVRGQKIKPNSFSKTNVKNLTSQVPVEHWQIHITPRQQYLSDLGKLFYIWSWVG